ncbi:MAG: hypothetical protein F6K55_07265 [Moorea sp. SIO4A3]|nr:hypothetical protein [Moorena sp. SIO4A3]
MANITIYDLAISPVYESFITELDEPIMDGILGGDKIKIKTDEFKIKIKLNEDGSLKKFKIKYY